tara:strand:+ start:494 stop:1807 length:1314 start_codon:yes stop_codon:yes gene_type:complete
MSTDAFDDDGDDDAKFFCPVLARAFALFVLATTTNPREPPRRFHWSLVVQSSERDDRGARATTTTRATMSRPDRWTDGIDDAFEAYGVDGRAAATLDVRASSDRWVRFERTFRDRRWIATTRAGWTEADENEDDAFGARMTIVLANVDGGFARRVSRSFVEGARAFAWPHVVDCGARDADGGAPAIAARAAAKSRARSEDAKWCVVMRARVEDARSYATETRGGAQVWIDGSMASWRIARRVVEHAFSMDPARFEAFGVEPIRRDSMDEGNPEHVVYFQAPRRARGGYVASFVAHFVSDSTRADLETAAARRVFVAALAGERAREVTLELPDASAHATASMVTNGLFAALAALKRDAFSREDDARCGLFLSPRDAAVAERNARVGECVLRIVDGATSAEARAFESRMLEEDARWRETFARALTTPVVSNDGAHELSM